jgi:ABC-type sugar transport system ATPase subunit/ribose/xylose/arabinose/galactoside ABC-type transport system permease subunit
MNPLVELAGISKSFPGVLALRGVDLALFPGRIHALVGENGAGKSTLLNILAGLLQPDAGEIRIAGQYVHLRDARAAWAAGIVTVHQEVDLFADLSVLENIGLQQGLPANALGWIDWRKQRQRTADALAAVGDPVSPDALAADLTPAQRQLVEIAGAVSRAARVLVLDEPTSSLSAAEAGRLFAHLRRFRVQGAAIVYVSHRFEEIFALADEVTVLRDGQRVWSGPVADTSPTQLIRHMVGRPVAAAGKGELRAGGPVRLECLGLTAVDESFSDVTLQAHGGEVLGLYGLVGAGRSEWAQAIFGLRRLLGGEVRIDGRPVHPRSPGQMARHGLAYVPEDRLRQGLCRGLSVRANAVLASLRKLSSFGWLPLAREARRAEAITTRLSVRCNSGEQVIGTLSGGNQQKVVLGRWLDRDPAVLILDEPTRGIDVGAREEIYALVHAQASAGRAVVLISSDLPEVMSQSDRIAIFREGQLVKTLTAGTASAEEVAALAFPTHSAEKKIETEMRSTGEKRRVLSFLRQGGGLALFVLVFFLLLHWKTGRFLQADSVRSLVTDTALLGFCAVGAMLVLLAGGLDISLGALMALCAGVAGQLWEAGQPLAVVVPTALAVGAAGGALNAALSLAGGVHPIVVTLGTMSVYRGLTLWWLGRDVQIDNLRREWLVSSVGGLPLGAWLGLALLLVVGAWLTFTVTGRELRALGSNPAAAHRAGISKARVWLLAFAVQGALVGLAGVLYLARTGGLQPTSHEDTTLEAIAAAVVGGVAITGGRGNVAGVALGTLFLVSLGPACIFLGISTRWQQSLVGAVLLAAVLLDALGRGREA